MSEANRRADNFQLYLTGAASDAGAQADPDASLGNYRSSTESLQLGFLINLPTDLPQIQIDAVSGGNGTGTGTITAASTTGLQYTPPGGVIGVEVAIADGETKLLEGDDRSKVVRVTRVGTDDLDGTMTFEMLEPYNSVLGMDNVTSAERAAGSDTYRALMMYSPNGASSIAIWIRTLGTQAVTNSSQLAASGAGTIATFGSFADWPDVGYGHIKDSGGTTREIVYYTLRSDTSLVVLADGRGLLGTSAGAGAVDDTVDAVPGIRIAEEATVADQIQTIADEETGPTGRTWKSGTTVTTGVTLSSIASGDGHGLWIHRQIPASAVVAAKQENALNIQYFAESE